MICFVGDVHDLLDPFAALLQSMPRQVQTIIQVGDLWVWPDLADVPADRDGAPRAMPRRPRDPSVHWRRPPRDVLFIDGNHHTYPLTRGLSQPTPVAAGLTYLPRGTVLTLPGRSAAVRVGFLGGPTA